VSPAERREGLERYAPQIGAYIPDDAWFDDQDYTSGNLDRPGWEALMARTIKRWAGWRPRGIRSRALSAPARAWRVSRRLLRRRVGQRARGTCGRRSLIPGAEREPTPDARASALPACAGICIPLELR
jgi:hypothetical protein